MNIGFIFSIIASITWGLAYALDQKVLEKITPISLISISYFVCFFLTLPFLFSDKKNIGSLVALDKKEAIIFFLAILLTFVANYFILAGIKMLDASTASVIEISYPIFVILFSIIIFRTMPNYLFFVGSSIAVFGIYIIMKSTNY